MLSEEPLVSIITPVFNRAHIVHNTVDSIIAQTYRKWELLLVDDCSTDNISEIIENKYRREPRICFYRRNREPKGASMCRNIGAENAKGDYLIFLDSDDLFEPFCLEQRVKVMIANPDLDFAVFPLKVMLQNGKYFCKDFDNGKDPLINFISKNSYWAIMCPIWRKQFFFEIGGFNDMFPRYQDIEIHIRALAKPGVKYTLCSDHEPDAEVIPSAKNDVVDFAMRLYTSLQLLIPQTFTCLASLNKTEFMKYMSGYLKEWLRYYAFSNFDNVVARKTDDVLTLFYKYRVISTLEKIVYKSQIVVVNFFIKLLKYAFIKSLRLL